MTSHFDKTHDGWLNLGGYIQYTLIRDVPDQFLFTGGLQWEAPTGESSVFQGHGPAYLAPYITGGKECIFSPPSATNSRPSLEKIQPVPSMALNHRRAS